MPRWIAWQVLQAVAAGAYADRALERQLSRSDLPPRDRALATELAYGAIRQRRRLDSCIDWLGRVPAQRQPPPLRWLLHIGLQQLLAMSRLPPSAVVNTSVELAKRHGLGRLAPVVNGILRSALRARDAADQPPLPEEPVARLGQEHSLPDWLAADLLRWLPPEQARSVAAACNAVPPIDLRVNPLRCRPGLLHDALQQAGVPAEPIAGLSAALTLPAHGGDLRRLPGYGEGWWSVQDRHAQALTPLLEPQPGQWVLDACAAPGGKATHLAELMQDHGTIWAVDRSDRRLRRLRANAERLGLQSIQPLAADALTLASERPDWIGRFDRILLDAPCSGLGTLARHADARWRLTPEAIPPLVSLQRRLLEAMVPLLAPGGRLLYATCTIHPAENRETAAAFLSAQPAWRCLQDQQVWPEPSGGDGFYAALLAPG
ncbi:16S rRNA (cytosine(967)-C(5))-methyltransferase [Synechococcus sp. RSCCF101]|uniref:16S rRNA (cytosine(967)-C(5))-methyltransferase n=1 Tax=Synechococcus sp. RSCCF101 TaxID=2511069 RepID=UPI002106129D|nr:16S rRNA (cytosine(967)-C(5))-methyltransferase [Synechococcus sp. RSCCF101]